MANLVSTLTGLTTPITFFENTVNGAPKQQIDKLAGCAVAPSDRQAAHPGEQRKRDSRATQATLRGLITA